jgi:hypothetical protein
MKTNRVKVLPYHIIESNEMAEVWQNNQTGEYSLHAGRAFKAQQVITSFKAAAVLKKPTYLTVQTGLSTHITLSPGFLQFCNHSCSPNTFFDTSRLEFIALQNIEPGDELTFFYPSTEWKMQQPFSCNCNTRNCLGTITGAAFLPSSVLKKYWLTDFIQQQLSQQSSSAS